MSSSANQLRQPCLLGPQHGDDVSDRPRVIVGARVADRIGPAPPHPRLHGPPERHRLRDHVGSVDVYEHRLLADDVADRGQQAVAGSIRQVLRAVQQQRRLVPHQLAAPHAVRGAADGADVVAPDLGGGEVRRAHVQRVEQAQDRLVLDAGEPLPRLRRLAGGRQVLEELLGLAGDAGRPQRFDEQRAAAALGSQHQVRGRAKRAIGHLKSLTAWKTRR